MNDYEKTIRVKASPAAVLDALTTTTGLTKWWTTATGDGAAGGELRFWFGHAEPLVIRVAEATDRTVRWEVTECGFLPDWAGTHPAFTLDARDPGCEVHFVHHGLTPDLECIDMCTNGWNHFISSLARYLDDGTGAPKGSPDEIARRVRETEEPSADVPAELRTYFEWFEEGGADLFHEAFLNLDPRTASIVTRDQLRAALPMRKKMFETLGVTGLTFAGVEPIELDDQHVLARTTWTATMIDPGAEPLTLRSSYLLRRLGASWEIVAYLNHQDLAAMAESA